MACVLLPKKHQGVLGQHELEMRDEGLIERTEFNESLHRWTGFHRVVSSGGYLYIYVTDRNVHVVPKRSFPSEGAVMLFRTDLERRFVAD